MGFLDEAMTDPAIVSLLPETDTQLRVLFRSKEVKCYHITSV